MEILDGDFKHHSTDDQKKIESLKLDSMGPVREIKGARIGLMFLIGFNVIGAFVGYSEGNDIGAILIESLIVCGIYLFSILTMYKNPRVALIAAATIYVLYNILLFIALPEARFSGFIFKGIVVYAFVKAIMSAFKFVELKRELAFYGEELGFGELELRS
jgi:hypothetical protein